MQRHHTTTAILFAVVLFLTGVLTINGNLFGNTAATAFVPGEIQVVEAEKDTVSEQHFIQEILENPKKVTPLPTEKVDTETLWLARVIYSETKRPEEMELVAWVIRNRVETGYRGNRNYQSAVLDPFQFSAFNPGDRKRTHYSSLTTTSNAPGFDNAIRIAFGVKNADPSYRPFSKTTRHFYSEQSMVGVKHPNWAKSGTHVKPQRNFTLEERRFRFFANVA